MVFSYIQTINTFFFLYFAQIVNFCILPIYMILKTFFFFQFLPRIYVYFPIYIVKTLFFLCILPRIIYIAIFLYIYIYAFIILVPFLYIINTLFSFLDLAQISSQCAFLLYIDHSFLFSLCPVFILYNVLFLYIQNKHLFFFFFQARYLYIVKFLCFIYILKTIENVYFLMQEIPLFFFCFPGYLRLFLCIGFAKIYSVFLYSIFSLYILPRRYGIYIYRVFSYIYI